MMKNLIGIILLFLAGANTLIGQDCSATQWKNWNGPTSDSEGGKACYTFYMGNVGQEPIGFKSDDAMELNISTRKVENVIVTPSNLSGINADLGAWANYFTLSVTDSHIQFIQTAAVPANTSFEFTICVDITALKGANYGLNMNFTPPASIADNNSEGDDEISSYKNVTGILPIELLSFTASARDNDVDLDWKTATELNNSHFEVQRSADGRNFENIGRVSGNGTTSQVISYDFTDTKPVSGKNYYRLKQVDFDGSFDYSPVEEVSFGGNNELKLYPNPASPGSEINIQGQKIRTVKIYNMLGQLVIDKVYDQPQSFVTISSANLSQGVYTTRVNGVDEKRMVIK